MKKAVNKLNFFIVGLMASVTSAVAADSDTTTTANGICTLVEKLGDLLGTLRTMAFIGAGFLIAQWAWEFITKPEEVKLDKLKPKGVGMVVGFILLFGIGLVIGFLMDVAGKAGCADEFIEWSVGSISGQQ